MSNTPPISLTRARRSFPSEQRLGRPRLVSHTPRKDPRTHYRPRHVQAQRLQITDRQASLSKAGKKRLRTLAQTKTRGKFQIGDVEKYYGLGQAYKRQITQPKQSLL